MDNFVDLFLFLSVSLRSVNTSMDYFVHVVIILPYEEYIYLFDQVLKPEGGLTNFSPDFYLSK